ncbi:hypothetical protein N0V83_003446 [Neocucurbitaria cava]|uniref:Uncharacterized protein n=1 Tax=Neocucurbitaria cava TaxID=798079 RepID=A0A9W9CPA6_9PLEO|nr:hypothetical protein N0V83_003446 [Neocucurbitaria cava]
MPGQFRTRLRRVLTGSPDEGGALSKFKSGRHTKTGLPESDFYQPGEKMPPLKYRRPVDPEHKKNLEAFSFTTAWRRHSHTSLSSFSSEYDHEEWVDSGIGASIAGDERPANIREASDDEGDVLNVGLSRNPTEDPRDARRKQEAGARRSSSVRQLSRPDTSSDRTRNASQPFSPEELEQALARSHLEATKEESDRSALETPVDGSETPLELEFEDPSPFLRPRGGSIYVPYDGQGTPPKLPFWGTAFPSNNDEMSSGHFSRRCSVAGLESGACTPAYERRESLFVPTDAPGLTQARRVSVFVPPEDEECVCPPEPTAAEPEAPKRKIQPCAPCDAIAAILARPD